jgi:hypothetical protein
LYGSAPLLTAVGALHLPQYYYGSAAMLYQQHVACMIITCVPNVCRLPPNIAKYMCCSSPAFLLQSVKLPKIGYLSHIMASIDFLCTQLLDLNAYIDTRAGSGCTADALATLKSAMTKSLVHQIKAMGTQVNPSGGFKMLDAINKSRLGEVDKQHMIEAVEQQMLLAMAPAHTAQQMLGTHEKQVFQTPEAHLGFFTASDWKSLQATDTPPDSDTKNQIIVDRLTKGGCVKPSEPTCADIVTSMWSLHWPHDNVDQPFKDRLYNHMQQLKDCFKTFRAHQSNQPAIAMPYPMLKVFPLVPSSLVPQQFAAMYPDAEDGPVQVKLEAWRARRAHVSCRNTNKCVRATPQTDIVPANAQMQQALYQLAGHLGLMQHAGPHIQILRPPMPGKPALEPGQLPGFTYAHAGSSVALQGPGSPPPDSPPQDAAQSHKHAPPGGLLALANHNWQPTCHITGIPPALPEPSQAMITPSQALAPALSGPRGALAEFDQKVQPPALQLTVSDMEKQHKAIAARAKAAGGVCWKY